MKGFTISELCVSLAVVSTLTVLSLPAFSQWLESSRYRQGARDIVNAMRLARSHAINKTREVEVDFDLDTNRYRLMVGDLAYGSTVWEELVEWSPLPDKVQLAVTKGCTKIGDGDPTTKHIDTIQFNPNGTCGASGSMAAYYICIMTSDMQPRYAGAVLSTTTGRATVRTWDPESEEWD